MAREPQSDPAEQAAVVVSTAPVEAPGAEEAAAAPVFRRLDDDEPARIVLHQVTPQQFQLGEGFRYRGRAGAWIVHPQDLPNTDLASIPRLMGWFANSYGRHTLGALLHDHLVRNGDALDPKVPRHRADDVFRIALGELGVPYLRSLIMWSAVVLATRWRLSPTARAAIVVWALAALAGVATLIWTALIPHPLAVVPLLAPLPFALLWGRREFVAGVVGGYTLWFISLPTVINFLAYGAYWTMENIVRLLVWIGTAGARRRAKPPPFGDR